jgi:hypothetical protein
VLSERRSQIVTVALFAAAPLCVLALGPRGLAIYVAAWVLALPQLLPELRDVLRAERLGVLFVFLTACSADCLDTAFEVEQYVTSMLVLLSVGYLVARRKIAAELARSTPFVALTIFFAQQAISAALLNPDELWLVASGLAAMLAAALAAAVLVRQPDGARAVATFVLLGGLVSVPVMVHELAAPDLMLFPTASVHRELRAGGLFAQPNNVGTALSFSATFLFVLVDRQQISRRTAAVLGLPIAVGLIACASRGALLIVLMVGGMAAVVATHRRAGRLPVASGLVIVGVLLVALPPLGRYLGTASERLEDVSPLPTARLGGVALALSGDAQELSDDDSSRSDLAREAWRLICERPLVGRGTHNFYVQGNTGPRSHVQFLELLGENGAVGGVLYFVFLLTLALAVARAPEEHRLSAALVFGVWFLNHFDKHTMLEFRFMVLPVGWICGLMQAAPSRAAAAPQS